jgi:hypothetical protein
MPDDASAPDAPQPEAACEKCGGALERLTRLPKFDHPLFDIFRFVVSLPETQSGW